MDTELARWNRRRKVSASNGLGRPGLVSWVALLGLLVAGVTGCELKRPAGDECLFDEDCPAAEKCVWGNVHACVPRSCRDEECGEGYTCDRDDDTCWRRCDRFDGDGCDSGYVCTEDSLCVRADSVGSKCLFDADCNGDTKCNSKTDTCIPRACRDSDCGPAYLCDREHDQCWTSCRSWTSACKAGYVCTNQSICVSAATASDECISDEDCEDSSKCSDETWTCVPRACNEQSCGGYSCDRTGDECYTFCTSKQPCAPGYTCTSSFRCGEK
jgi:hypothetical protein